MDKIPDGAVSSALVLIEKVLHRMDQQANLYATLKSEVKAIQKWLERMQAYLVLIEKGRVESNGVQTVRVSQVREVAHHIEDVIDELMFCVPHRYHKYKVSEKAHNFTRAAKVWNPLSSIQGMKAKFEDIKKEINDIITIDKLCEISCLNTTSDEATSSGMFIGQHAAPYALDDCEIVGFVRQREDIINWLTEARAATSSRNMVSTISVVGPGGSGKTALVKNVFQHCKKEGLFDCYALVQLSQSLKLDELLQSILFQFNGLDEELVVHAPVTQVKIGHYIQQRKYLVVLDDLWSKKDWMSIIEIIPRHLGIYGSRIIVTTRNYEVASVCAQPPRYLINLDGALQESEAQSLFCMHAFPTNDGFLCPPELSKWLQKFLERCEGLPSAIVDIGTLLSRKHSNQLLEWEKIHDSLIKSDLSLPSNVLIHSFKDLPCSLRKCFLYFSIFPRDYAIERGRLIRLWIAEGFVSENRNRSLEEVAEGYLSELIGRNLVHVSKWDFDERARYCRVRSHVYDFIIHKSEEVNFVSVFSERPDSSKSKKLRHLSLQGDCSSSWLHDQDLSLVRSALFFRKAIASSSAINAILHAFKLLRVLDLRDAPLTEFPEVIVTLVLLRYLCLRNTKVKKLPNSIKKLSQLETLDLKRSYVTQLPEGVLQLRNLRHLLVYRCNTGSHVDWDLVEGVELGEGIGLLNSLQKLLLVKPKKDQKVLKELENLVRLRKLGIIGLKDGGGKDLCTSIENMRDLSTLDISSSSKHEVLDLNYIINPPPHIRRLYLNGPLRELHNWILSLTSLLKLTLKWSRLNGDTFEALQRLPNLIELEMVAAFDGDALVFKAGSFKKLKILHIEQFNQLKFVEIEEGSVFELQKLSLSSCVNLEMLPLGIYTLASLKQLLLFGMPREFIHQLETNSEDREMISCIPVINVFVPGPDGSWSLERSIA